MNIKDYIDQNDLSERLDGDFDLFKDLAIIFFEDYTNLLSSLTDAISKNDPVMIAKSAHTIKGAVSNFSATQAFDLALQLERNSKEGKIKNAQAMFTDLKQSILNTMDAMQTIIDNGTFS